MDQNTPGGAECNDHTLGTISIRRSSTRNSESKRNPQSYAKLVGAHIKKRNKLYEFSSIDIAKTKSRTQYTLEKRVRSLGRLAKIKV